MKKWLLCVFICTCLPLSVFAQSAPRSVGINLSAIVDWTTAHPFVDVFKTARTWIPQKRGAGWGEGGDLALTPEGWVASLAQGQYAETLVFSAEPALDAGMDGDYALLYDGDGDFTFSGNATVKTSAQGRIELGLRPSQGAVFLQLLRTNPADPARNIRLIMAEYESTYASAPFNPRFLEVIRPFGALRFMDWMNTNHEPPHIADNRPLPTDYTYAWRGVPAEVMVQLANTLNADAWFTMPHNATDDYVRAFATVVRDTLAPDLRAYVEYSNETWNGQFIQARYVVDMGLASGLGNGDAFWAGLQYHSQRAVEMFRIWEDVFGGTSRLVRVLSSQAANAWTGEQVLEFNQAYQHVDALSIAPYFSCDDPANPNNVASTLANGVDALLAQQLKNVQVGGCAYAYITDNLALARDYGVTLLAYEGGQHLSGYFGTENNDALTELFIAANRHPMMKDVYLAYFEAWYSLGDGTFMVFADITAPSRFGSWGLLEAVTQDVSTAPKYQAVLEVIRTQRP